MEILYLLETFIQSIFIFIEVIRYYFFQRIGCLTHSRDNDQYISMGSIFKYRGHVAYTLGIFDGGSSEFVNLHKGTLEW